MARDELPASDRLLTPAEVARMFKVDPVTGARWGRSGRIPSVRTLGGHRRYPEAWVLAHMESTRQERTP